MFSCETALANIVNKWAKAIDDGLLNGVVLLDLRKAFDLIDHQILLKKLKMYKCSNNTMKWFQSYVDHRPKCTVFKGQVSETFPLTCGVPQGSILRPLFFILFINDLPLHIENSDCDMYADDSCVPHIPILSTLIRDVNSLSTLLLRCWSHQKWQKIWLGALTRVRNQWNYLYRKDLSTTKIQDSPQKDSMLQVKGAVSQLGLGWLNLFVLSQTQYRLMLKKLMTINANKKMPPPRIYSFQEAPVPLSLFTNDGSLMLTQ